jgi:hypothetical protein
MTDKNEVPEEIWWDLKYMLVADPYEPAQQGYREISRLLRNYLIEHGLVREGKFPPVTAPVPDDFVIRMSDLTEDGAAFLWYALPRWLRANDDIRKPISMRSLDRSLKKLREEGPAALSWPRR